MKRTTIFVQDELERELQALARRNGRPMASVVREALEQYVVAARREGPARPGFIAVGRSGRRDIADRHEELLFEARGETDAGKGRVQKGTMHTARSSRRHTPRDT